MRLALLMAAVVVQAFVGTIIVLQGFPQFHFHLDTEVMTGAQMVGLLISGGCLALTMRQW